MNQNLESVIPGGLHLRRVPSARRQATYDDEVAALISATRAVMARKGCAGRPRLAEIIAEADISNQAFYRHFRSRDDAIVATYEQGLMTIHEYLEHQVRKQPDLPSQIAAWVDGVLAQIQDPELSELSRAVIWNVGQVARTDSEIKPVGHDRIRGLLSEVLTEGGVDDPDRTALFIHTLVMGLTNTFLEDNRRPSPADRESLLRFCANGITPGAAAPG